MVTIQLSYLYIPDAPKVESASITAYCTNEKLLINYAKTKVIDITKKHTSCMHNWKISIIEQVNKVEDAF